MSLLQKIPELQLKNQYFEGGAKGLTKDSFEYLGLLGSGAFGKVYKVTSKLTGSVYALKILSKNQISSAKLQEQLLIEISILCNCQHENIIKIFGAFEDAQHIYLILEFANNSTLFAKLRKERRFTEAKAAHYLRQVALAVQYLHSQTPAIIHRDLKPENILLHDEKCKIADFGWSNKDADFRNTYCGTPDYLAPEMIVGTGHNEKLDIWTIGVLLYEVLHGRTPFAPPEKPRDKTNLHRLIEKNILDGKFEIDPSLSETARDTILKLMQTNSELRPSIKQVLDLPFFALAETSRRPKQESSLRELKNIALNYGSNQAQLAPPAPLVVAPASPDPFKEKLLEELTQRNKALEKQVKTSEGALKEKSEELAAMTANYNRVLQELNEVKAKPAERSFEKRNNSKASDPPSPERDAPWQQSQVQTLLETFNKQESTLNFLFKRTKDLADFVDKFYLEHFTAGNLPLPQNNKSLAVNFERLGEQLRVIFNDYAGLKSRAHSPLRNNRSAYQLTPVKPTYRPTVRNVTPELVVLRRSRSPDQSEPLKYVTVIPHGNGGSPLYSSPPTVIRYVNGADPYFRNNQGNVFK